jgi:hypothetical protein
MRWFKNRIHALLIILLPLLLASMAWTLRSWYYNGSLPVLTLISRSRCCYPLNYIPPHERPVSLRRCDVSPAEIYILSHPDYTSYHLLFAIRTSFPERYACLSPETKAAVLCSTLQHVLVLNDWGCLDDPSCDGEAALALLETGSAAIPFLQKILDDDADAFLEGSADATVSINDHYRRCDFAYRYICLINRWPPRYSTEIAERDRYINKLKTRLSLLEEKPEDKMVK